MGVFERDEVLLSSDSPLLLSVFDFGLVDCIDALWKDLLPGAPASIWQPSLRGEGMKGQSFKHRAGILSAEMDISLSSIGCLVQRQSTVLVGFSWPSSLIVGGQ